MCKLFFSGEQEMLNHQIKDRGKIFNIYLQENFFYENVVVKNFNAEEAKSPQL